jgi:hypothetical protein
METKPNVSPTFTISPSLRGVDPRRCEHGSVIALVVVFTAVLALIAAGLLNYTLSERRITKRFKLNLEAQNSADAALEYAGAELIQRFDNNRSFGTSDLTSAPIKALVNRRAALYSTAITDYDDVVASTVQLWASQVSQGTQQYIDPSDLSNAFDPLRGQQVSVQAVRLLGQGNAQDAAGNSLTSYGGAEFEVRDASLFNYAIFYNMTLEFQPSPPMTVSGPVRSNGDVYLTTDTSLTFLSTFATAGKFYSVQSTQGRPTGQNIYFTNGLTDSSGNLLTVGIDSPLLPDGTHLNTCVDSSLNSRDSRYQFNDVAEQLWKAYVADASMGIQPANPPGVTDPTTAHKLIEPPDTSSSADPNIEEQKFANKAGLYLVVQQNNGTVTAFSNAQDASSYKAAVTAGTVGSWLTTVQNGATEPNSHRILALPTGAVKSNRVMWDNRENKWVNTVDIDAGTLRTAVNSTSSTPIASLITVTTGTGSHTTTVPWSLDHNGASSSANVDPNDQGWNGVVYVDVMNPASGRSTTSDVSGVGTQTGSETAVRLVDGSQLPNRAQTSSGTADGFTVATNAPAYVVGDYNATYSSSDSPTTPRTNESPASIAADSVNILSNAWWKSSSKLPVGDGNNLPSSSAPTATNTEVSAAFLTGIVETSGDGAGTSGANSTYSGGVENYPRFHENWSSKTLLYRGSIVALFDSRVATGQWIHARYNPPNRTWGFNSLYGTQRRFPPGTPILRTYRRINYQRLNAAQFQALKSSTTFNYTLMQ